MNLLVWLCILSIAIPVIGGCVVAIRSPSQRERYAPLYEALRLFAAERKAEVREVDTLGALRCELHVQVAGEACSVELGWMDSSFLLRLRVQLPGLSQEDFEECWERDWVRFLKRDYDQRLYVNSSSYGLSLSGPSQALRETFAEVGRAEMALLFGATLQGPCEGYRRLNVGAESLTLTVEFPDASLVQDLAPRLAALVRLAEFSRRPFGEDAPSGSASPSSSASAVGPRSAGKVLVTLQPGQRCSYCRESLLEGGAPVKTCAACRSSLHAACLEEHGGCCTVGCRNNPRER